MRMYSLVGYQARRCKRNTSGVRNRYNLQLLILDTHRPQPHEVQMDQSATVAIPTETLPAAPTAEYTALEESASGYETGRKLLRCPCECEACWALALVMVSIIAKTCMTANISILRVILRFSLLCSAWRTKRGTHYVHCLKLSGRCSSVWYFPMTVSMCTYFCYRMLWEMESHEAAKDSAEDEEHSLVNAETTYWRS